MVGCRVNKKVDIALHDNKDTILAEIDNVKISSSLEDMEIILDGTRVSLPCTYGELSDLGFYVGLYEDIDKKLIAKNHYENLLLYRDGKVICGVHIANTSSDDALLKDCYVVSVNQKLSEIVFPGNIMIGSQSSISQLKELFGEPSVILSLADFGDNDSISYRWYANGIMNGHTSSYIEIVLEKDLIVKSIIVNSYPN